MRKKWTIEELQIEADKCSSRKEFRENNNGAYSASIKRKIIDELFRNHINQGNTYKQVKCGFWTKDIIKERANKYITRREFEINDKGAYLYAYKNNLLDEIFKNHINCGYSNQYNYWTEKKLNEIILNYDSRADLYKNNKSAFNSAHKLNLMNDLFKNHVNSGYTKQQDGYWSYENLQKEANRYENRKDFRKNSKSAYQKSVKLSIINELFKNHVNNGYSDKEEWKENNYVIYVYELTEFNKAYVGLTNNINRRDKEHIFTKTEKMNQFCKKHNIPIPMYKIIESGLCSSNVREREEYWMNYYKNEQWYLFNINKAGSLGGNSKEWNKKSLKNEVNKYKTRGEFSSKNISAYTYARKHKLLYEIFKNHENNGYCDKQEKSGFWTKDDIQKYADIYKTRREFEKQKKGGYLYAYRNNLLDDIFKNHENNGYDKSIRNYWTNERLQIEVNKYKTRNELRNKEPKIYGVLKTNKLLDELFKNHENNGCIRKKKSE